jgi:hypothetical protein
MLGDVGEHWEFFGGLPASTISSELHIEYEFNCCLMLVESPQKNLALRASEQPWVGDQRV